MLQSNGGGWSGMLQGLLGGGMYDDAGLTEEEKERLRRQAMMASGAAMLQGSGWSQTPITTGQAMGAGMQAGQQAHGDGAQRMMQLRGQQAKAAQERAALEAQKQLQAMIESGAPIDEKMAVRLVSANPALSNTVQQLLKNRAPAKAATPMSVAAKQLVDAGYTYGTPEFQEAMKVSLEEAKKAKAKGGSSKTPERWVTIPASELQRYNLPAGTVAQVSEKTGQIKILAKPAKAEEGADGGMNPRQKAGTDLRAEAFANYASQLTGTPVAELRGMSREDLQAHIIKNGKRTVQGGIARMISGIPFVGDGIVKLANPDLQPYANQAASGQAMVNNPSGPITGADQNAAQTQMPSAEMPLEVQAEMLARGIATANAASAPAGNQPRVPIPQTQADYDALPSGAEYIDPDDGKRYRKP